MTPPVTYQVVCYIEYTSEFSGLNGLHAENRGKPMPQERPFKFSAMTSQPLGPIKNSACRVVKEKQKHCSGVL